MPATLREDAVHVPEKALVFSVQGDARATALLDPHHARAVIADLLTPNPRTYWADFLGSAAIGWTAVAIAVLSETAWLAIAAGVVAVLALYRALLFSHELVHVRANTLRGFRVAWELFAGIPMLLPAVMYAGVHADHHRASTYGTERDPEYLPFAGARKMITLFIAHSFLLPPLLAVRFLILAPVGWLYAPFHTWLECHASSVSMNTKYVRDMTARERTELRRSELCLLAFWAAAVALLISAGMALKTAAVYFCVMECIAVINCLRTLAAHRYHSTGAGSDKNEQVLDSIDTPGNVFSELWAPVGLRYHALHHFVPTIPYHNLSRAYRRLMSLLPPSADYRQTSNPGLLASLSVLWKGKQ